MGGGIPSFLFRSVVEVLIVFAAVESCAKFASMSGTINDDEASLVAECAMPWGLARYCVGDVVCMIVFGWLRIFVCLSGLIEFLF